MKPYNYENTMPILRLFPEQVMEHWEYIRPLIERALPPYAKDMSAVQESLLMDGLQCWAYLQTPDASKISGLITTRIIQDDISKAKSLLVFSLTIVERLTREGWLEGLEGLKKFAASRGCTQIITYTNQDTVRHIAKTLGGSADWTMILFEV